MNNYCGLKSLVYFIYYLNNDVFDYEDKSSTSSLFAEENYVFNEVEHFHWGLGVGVSSGVTLAYFRIGKFSHKYKMCAIRMELIFESPRVIGN